MPGIYFPHFGKKPAINLATTSYLIHLTRHVSARRLSNFRRPDETPYTSRRYKNVMASSSITPSLTGLP